MFRYLCAFIQPLYISILIQTCLVMFCFTSCSIIHAEQDESRSLRSSSYLPSKTATGKPLLGNVKYSIILFSSLDPKLLQSIILRHKQLLSSTPETHFVSLNENSARQQRLCQASSAWLTRICTVHRECSSICSQAVDMTTCTRIVRQNLD